MSQISFSIFNIIETGWCKFKKQPFFWIAITVLNLLVGSIGSSFDIDVDTFETSINPIGVAASLLSLYISAAITLMAIKYMRGELISFHHLTAISINKFVHYFLATVVSTIFIIIGFILFILPGIYIMSRLLFVRYLVVDKNLNFDEAIKQSWKMTNDNVFTLYLFLCMLALILLIGFILFVVGLLIAIPIITLASAELYLLFSKNNSSSIIDVE
ncbi:MAG: hypothetical protein CMP49_03770 [Flavobacteriales bacterium]|nr:hypothetical protein [Flavobacteriales bacterium]|tara:strand:+ start:100 stop:744 length:645 start_codon:yes stop_codon:yes gene_type:complete